MPWVLTATGDMWHYLPPGDDETLCHHDPKPRRIRPNQYCSRCLYQLWGIRKGEHDRLADADLERDPELTMSPNPRDLGLDDVEPERSDPYEIDQPNFITQFLNSLGIGTGGDDDDR